MAFLAILMSQAHHGPERSRIAAMLVRWIKIVNNQEPFDDSVTAYNKDKHQSAVDILAAIWKDILFSSDTSRRHKISNIIGMIALNATMKMRSQWHSHFKAIIQSAVVLGVISDEDLKSDGKEWIKSDNLRIKGMDVLRLILIDDMAFHGWAEIVCQAVGLEYDKGKALAEQGIHKVSKSDACIEVWADNSSNEVLKNIEDLEGKRPFQFQLTNHDGKNVYEILLFDLRLFDEDQSLSDELLHLKRSLSVFQKMTDPAWDNNSASTHLQQMERQKPSEARSDPFYLEALTYLPRAIALCDMAYPVIIFSSTGQADIIKLFNENGNIITECSKPRFFGYKTNNFKFEVEEKFNKAIQKAVDILKGRYLCQQIMKCAKQDKPEPIESGSKYVEIFIDESGDFTKNNDFVVARLLLIHKSEDDAKKIHDEMFNAFVNIPDDAGNILRKRLAWCGTPDID